LAQLPPGSAGAPARVFSAVTRRAPEPKRRYHCGY